MQPFNSLITSLFNVIFDRDIVNILLFSIKKLFIAEIEIDEVVICNADTGMDEVVIYCWYWHWWRSYIYCFMHTNTKSR